jgi:hypothetical protein
MDTNDVFLSICFLPASFVGAKVAERLVLAEAIAMPCVKLLN